MNGRTATKIQHQSRRQYAQQEVRRNLRAWRGLYRVFRNRGAMDPVAWQKKIRKEWERKVS